MPRKKVKKPTELEQFLSAPDTIHKDKTEKQKALQRKAMLEAKEARLAAEKLKTRPSDEDLLGDMVRVAEDKVVNPYWRFRTLSRKRYWLYGHWPIKWIEERYGQFEHAKQVAGLADQPGTRLKKAARAQASRREHAARYIERVIRPHVLKDPALTRTLKNAELWFFISDTHSTFLDPFTWQVFLAAIRDLKPEGVYFNGDILECQEISRFPKIPGWTCPLQLELDFAREMFRQVREVGHDGPLIWGGGNHGIDRIAMYLTQVAFGVASLRSLRFDKLAELDELNVTLAQGGTIASPEGTEDDRMGLLLYGFFRVHHGTLLGQNPALSELKAAGRSGTSGHAHRALLAYGANEALQGMSWMSTPAACTERAARAYIKGVNTGWQKGFGLAYLYPDGDVHQYPVITDRDRATVEGYIYERRRNLKDPDPSKLWLQDLPKI
jgi:ribosomal protein L22